MEPLRLLSLTIHTIGVLGFGAIFLLSLRGLRRRPLEDGRLDPESCRPVSLAGLALVGLVALWYAAGIGQLLAPLFPSASHRSLQMLRLVLSFLFPPLIMHTAYQDAAREHSRPPEPAWGWVLALAYAVGPASAALSLAGFHGKLGVPPRIIGVAATTVLTGLFIGAGIFGGLVVQRGRQPRAESVEQRRFRRAHVSLYALLALISVPLLLSLWFERASVMDVLVTLLVPLIPMGFLFVGTYFEDRFEFFDLFVKRGLFLLVTAFLVATYVGAVGPALDRLDLRWARPWASAVSALPLAAFLAWTYRHGGRWIDRVWLGRSYSAREAMQHFLSAARSATTEEELLARSETALGEIFRAPVTIAVEGSAGDGSAAALEVPVRSAAGRLATLRVRPRPDRLPFFSEDASLMESLGGVLASLLENVRLQARKQEHERRTRELSLHASRSELKALRAQINPHFLFNALNAIAGLIHQDPTRADRTVEELAEVFRYTLRRSETEWARVEEELAFARAYLEVERARFGERFTFEVACDDGAGGVRIPVMMVQTLVENAIKHGAAAVRGPAEVRVSAGAGPAGRVRIEVADNGPGFGRAEPEADGGYGLRNVEQRLRGHYGEGATLRWGRDGGRTVVTIELPRAPLPSRAAGREGSAA